MGDGRGYLADEIWAFGLRHPWKFDVDVASGQIIVGDVGDRLWEEINGAAWERNLLGILPGDLITSIGEGYDGVQYVGTVAKPGPIYRLYIP